MSGLSTASTHTKRSTTTHPARSARSRLATGVVVLLCTSWLASAAQAQSGIQVTPDGARTLVSKDIAGQRWAITRNPDGTVTGNVFSPSGGAPQFVSCEQRSVSDTDVALACSGADACPLGPCEPDEWVFIADVTLPLSFFSTESASSLAAPSGFPATLLTPMRRLGTARPAGVAGTPSGLQLTPDAVRTLISKDVGDQRWAISRNEDGTVTGNVFLPTGGDPQFVWCEQTGESDGNVLLRCLGAAPCARGDGAACSGEGWQLIADGVPLPASFFLPRETVTIESIEAVMVAEFGEDGAASALVLALDHGYTVRQIVRAALAGRLLASGEINTAGGAVEPPDDTPPGLFTNATASRHDVIAGAPSVFNLADFLKQVKADGADLGYTVLFLVFRLVEQGYPIEQIVNHVFRDQGLFAVDPDTGDTILITNQGGVVFPKNPAGNTITKPGGPQPSPTAGSNPTPTPRPTGAPTPAPTPGPTGEPQPTPAPTQGGGCTGGTVACEGGCIPSAADCCDGEGGYCAAGTVCVGENLCCPSAQPKRCGTSCVAAGASCCGNGSIEGDEACDGADLGGNTCESLGKPPGALRCSSCAFDFSGCACDPGYKLCGDDCIPNAAVCCDGGRSCPAGTTCSAEGCCGNGAKEGGEVCDGAVGCDADQACAGNCSSCTSTVVCGNGVREGSEVCDPPGSTSACGSGEVCGVDCQCVSTTSCAGRCCAGRNDSCTPPGVSCYCDQFCVESGDCCADYGASCG